MFLDPKSNRERRDRSPPLHAKRRSYAFSLPRQKQPSPDPTPTRRRRLSVWPQPPLTTITRPAPRGRSTPRSPRRSRPLHPGSRGRPASGGERRAKPASMLLPVLVVDRDAAAAHMSIPFPVENEEAAMVIERAVRMSPRYVLVLTERPVPSADDPSTAGRRRYRTPTTPSCASCWPMPSSMPTPRAGMARMASAPAEPRSGCRTRRPAGRVRALRRRRHRRGRAAHHPPGRALPRHPPGGGARHRQRSGAAGAVRRCPRQPARRSGRIHRRGRGRDDGGARTGRELHQHAAERAGRSADDGPQRRGAGLAGRSDRLLAGVHAPSSGRNCWKTSIRSSGCAASA